MLTVTHVVSRMVPLVALLSSAIFAQPTTVTFADLPDSRFFNGGGQNIGAFYRGFTLGPNVTALNATRFSGYNSAAYPSHAGDVVIWDAKDSTITVSFASAITSFGIWYSSFVQLTMQALDQNGALVGSATGIANSNGVNGASALMTLNGAGMRTIKIVGSPGLFTLSSLTYEGLADSPCNYAVSAGGQEFQNTGGTATINVSAPAGCPWSVSSASVPSWIQIVGPTNGNGDGSIIIQVQANSGDQRTAILTIADLPFMITQLGPTPSGLTEIGSLTHIASAGTWKTSFTYLNLGTTVATARTEFFDNNGAPLALPFTFPQTAVSAPTITSGLERLIQPASMFLAESTGPDSHPVLEGWGQFKSNGSLSGFSIFSNPSQKWEAVVPLETRKSTSYTLAFDNTDAISTGVAISNALATEASVTVVILGDSGVQLASDVLKIAGRGHVSFMLGTEYPVTQAKRGVVRFTTAVAGQISALGLRANGPALTTLPVLADVGTTGGSLTHVTYNGGFITIFSLVNTGTTPADATLKFFDDAGGALPIPLTLPQSGSVLTASTLTRNLAPGASLVIRAQGQDDLPTIAGSAQLTTNGNVSGFAIFIWKPFGQEASVPLETREPSSYFLAFDNTGGLATGLALANRSNQLTGVLVTFRDDNGGLLLETTIMLSPNGHIHFMLPDRYDVTAGKRGTAQFSPITGGAFSVIGLRANAIGNLTTMPVQSK